MKKLLVNIFSQIYFSFIILLLFKYYNLSRSPKFEFSHLLQRQHRNESCSTESFLWKLRVPACFFTASVHGIFMSPRIFPTSSKGSLCCLSVFCSVVMFLLISLLLFNSSIVKKNNNLYTLVTLLVQGQLSFLVYM